MIDTNGVVDEDDDAGGDMACCRTLTTSNGVTANAVMIEPIEPETILIPNILLLLLPLWILLLLSVVVLVGDNGVLVVVNGWLDCERSPSFVKADETDGAVGLMLEEEGGFMAVKVLDSDDDDDDDDDDDGEE